MTDDDDDNDDNHDDQSINAPQRFPPHLHHVATLHCKLKIFKKVADFHSILNKLLTCSWRHFEDLI